MDVCSSRRAHVGRRRARVGRRRARVGGRVNVGGRIVIVDGGLTKLLLHRISLKWQHDQCEQRARTRSTKKTIQQCQAPLTALADDSTLFLIHSTVS